MRLIDADSLQRTITIELTDLRARMKSVKAQIDVSQQISYFMRKLRNEPTVDTDRHGHWIYKAWHDDQDGGFSYCEAQCSECEEQDSFTEHRILKYCPWCGAKMDQEVSE